MIDTSAAGLAKRHLELCQLYFQESYSNEQLRLGANIKIVEGQLQAYPRPEATTALLQVLQPYVAQPTQPSEQAAVLRTWGFLQSLYQPPVRRVWTPKPESEELPEDLDSLISLIRDLNEERRRKAMTRILMHRAAAVPELEAALPRSTSPLVRARIIYLLAKLGEARLMTDAWQGYQDAITSEVREILEEALLLMAQTLKTAPQKLPWRELVELYGATRSAFPSITELLADAIIRLAKTDPSLELRMALPYLQGSWLRPLSPLQREVRKAIEEATRNLAVLPLPASMPSATENLPLPAESKADSTDLPQPARESPHAD